MKMQINLLTKHSLLCSILPMATTFISNLDEMVEKIKTKHASLHNVHT